MIPNSRPAGQRTGQKTTRVTNGLVALGSASVFAIYAIGYTRTKAASERFADDATPRRRPAPVPAEAPPPTMSLPPLAETAPPAAVGRSAAADSPVDARSTTDSAPALRATPSPVVPARESSAAPVAKTTSSPMVAENTGASALGASTGSPTAAAPAAAAPAVETSVAPVAAATATPTPSALAAAATVGAPVKVALKDGSYTGWGTCRHGDIQATVVIASGRILSATISQCWTRYPCSWISPLPPQVAQRQSAEVDYVTGATQSTNAFYDAVMDALAKAK
ncbi:MAG: FMN-binding protein [Acidobacteriota bacterium]